MTGITNFSDREKQTLYNQEIQNNFQPSAVATSPQEQWTYIADVCKDTGKEILGHKERKHKINDPELKELSQESHKLHLDISASKDKNKRANLRAERKRTIKLIRKKISSHQSQVIEEKLQQLETLKDDSNNYYQVLRSINNNKRKQPLCVQDEDGNIIISEKDQAEIISHHFCQLFAPDDASTNTIKSYAPCAMITPFTGDEIYEAAKSMKNGKSSGIDDIGLHAEHIKYAPPSIHENIAHIYLNTTAKDGNPPDELKIGILTPLPKAGKKKGPPGNLRPIILLSVLRTLLTICLMRRTWDRLKTRIPLYQAAYQEGRSTTEQVFSMKLLAEKTITSSDYKIYILLLDMSKAFDTVNRNQLFETLEDILLPDEIHLLHILTNDFKLKVRVGADYGPEYTTSVGIMQGDCLNAVLFILYLAKALSSRPPLETEHCYSRPPQRARDAPSQLLDHTYAENPDVAPLQPFNMRHSFTVMAKYADDITYASTSKDEINLTKVTVPEQLHAYNLHVNEHKTEEYTVPDATPIRGKDSWRKCKLWKPARHQRRHTAAKNDNHKYHEREQPCVQ